MNIIYLKRRKDGKRTEKRRKPKTWNKKIEEKKKRCVAIEIVDKTSSLLGNGNL